MTDDLSIGIGSIIHFHLKQPMVSSLGKVSEEREVSQHELHGNQNPKWMNKKIPKLQPNPKYSN